VRLNGAGASFPTIIYQDWIISYNKATPGVELNYQSIGSGGGIQQFTQGTVEFGASDAPMSDKQYHDAAKAGAPVKFVWWAETAGQARCADLGYAPLPEAMQPWIRARLESITAQGRSVWAAK